MGFEAPVAVPTFGEYRRLFVGAAGQCHYRVVVTDRYEIRVITQLAKVAGNAHKVRVAELLLGKRQHVVL